MTKRCITRLKTTWQARPEDLARYIAVSASRSRSSGRSYSGVWTAMPMLAVAKTSWPPRLIGAVRRSWMRSATRTASLTSRPPSSRIANSSPPTRAMVSEGRSAAASEPAIWISRSSPTRWPRLSLTILKRSRSRKRTAVSRSGSRRERSIDCAQAVHEQRPVGEAGQLVVQGVVEELLLGVLAVGDVVRVEHDAGDRGLGEEVRGGRFEHPPGAVAVAQPVLEGHDLVRLVEELAQGLVDDRAGRPDGRGRAGSARCAPPARGRAPARARGSRSAPCRRRRGSRSGPRRSGPASGSAPRSPAGPPRRAGGR